MTFPFAQQEELLRFLLEAKRRTYASQGDEATVPLCWQAPSSSNGAKGNGCTAISTMEWLSLSARKPSFFKTHPSGR